MILSVHVRGKEGERERERKGEPTSSLTSLSKSSSYSSDITAVGEREGVREEKD